MIVSSQSLKYIDTHMHVMLLHFTHTKLCTYIFSHPILFLFIVWIMHQLPFHPMAIYTV